MEQLTTTYTVKIERGDIWVFKYNLNGVLVHFNVLEGEITEKHKEWLFIKGKFPFLEEHIKDWKKTLKQLTIEVGETEISFDTFWIMYPYNALSKKKLALERWNKLKQSDRIKCLMKIPEFIKLKNQQNTSFPYAEVFINQRWWDQ